MRPQAEPENAGPPSTDAKPVRNYMAVQLGLSIFCAYIAAALLVVGPPLLMVEPIPLLGDLSVLDELADLGIVRDVDVGTGFMKASPGRYEYIKARCFGNSSAICFPGHSPVLSWPWHPSTAIRVSFRHPIKRAGADCGFPLWTRIKYRLSVRTRRNERGKNPGSQRGG